MRKQREHFAAVDDVQLLEEVVADAPPSPAPAPSLSLEPESAENCSDRNAAAAADELARKPPQTLLRRVKSPFRTYSRRFSAATAPEQPDA